MAGFDNVESVIDNPLAFSEKFKIDANALAALGLKKNLREFLLESNAGAAEAIIEGVREKSREENTTEVTKKEIAAEVGKKIGTAVVQEIAAKFGKEIADEVGVDVATELAAEIGTEIAGEAGAESARSGVAKVVGENKEEKNIVAKVGGDILDEIPGSAVGLIANSSLIASTFFPAKGILGVLGIATATTPTGWAIGASIAAAVLYKWGKKGLHSAGEDGDLGVIPNFFKTPLDVLAFRLFYFFAPLGLKVALADSTFAIVERRFIGDYFQHEWGYSKEFIQDALIEIEENIHRYDIVELTESLIEFKKDNPSYVYGNIPTELKKFLYAVMRCDGNIDRRELDVVSAIIAAKESQLRDFWNGFLGSNA